MQHLHFDQEAIQKIDIDVVLKFGLYTNNILKFQNSFI